MPSRLIIPIVGCLLTVADSGAHSTAWRQCLTDAPPTSIAACTSIIILDPQNDGAYVNRGIAYRRAGDFPHALSDYSEAIRLNPRAADAFNNRGNTYRALHRNMSALKDYNEAIRLKPTYAQAYNNRGIVLLELGSAPRAIADFDRAIAEDATYANAFRNRGVARTTLHLFDAAIEDFDAALRLDPEVPHGSEYAVALYGRGLARQADADERGAADLEHAKQLFPSVAEVVD